MLLNKMKDVNSCATRTAEVLMIASVSTMALLIITSVLVRNLMGFSFQWIVDVNRLIFIWMCFLGLIYINDKDVLIRFDIIDKHFSPGLHKIFTIVRHVLSLFLYGVMFKAGIEVSEIAKAQTFSTIPVSTCWMYIAVVAAGIVLLYQTFVKILELMFSAERP